MEFHKKSIKGIINNDDKTIIKTMFKEFYWSDYDIEKLLNFDKGSVMSVIVLHLLYPDLKLDQIDWHQDHIHPYSKFNYNNLKALGLDEDKIAEWQIKRNKIPNLQLLAGRENESKNNKDLVDWLKDNEVAYLPENISYDLQNFDEFYEKRKQILKEKLIEILK